MYAGLANCPAVRPTDDLRRIIRVRAGPIWPLAVQAGTEMLTYTAVTVTIMFEMAQTGFIRQNREHIFHKAKQYDR